MKEYRMVVKVLVKSNGNESYYPIICCGSVVKVVGHTFKYYQSAMKEGRKLLKEFSKGDE